MSSILIYTVGDRTHGMGHVMRCLTLADALTERGFGITFATQHETPGLDRIRRSPYPVIDYAPDDMAWTNRYGKHGAVIIDVENGPTRAALEMTRRFHRVVVIGGSGWIMQDREAIRELADLFICQTILPTDGDMTGVGCMIIRPEYAQCVPDYSGHILISMGGGDPHGLTHQVLNALEDIGRKLVVINGQASEAIEISEANDSIMFVHAPDSLASYMNGASLFIGALGMSAYEAAAAGVPSLLTAWSDDHEATTKALAAGDCAVNLGLWSELDGEQLRQAALDVLGHEARWRDMSAAGRMLIDGKGAGRVAERIAQLVRADVVMVLEPKVEHIIRAEATVRPRKKAVKRDNT